VSLALRSLQRDWDALGQKDALGAIFTGTELARDPAAFFATGQVEVDAILAELSPAGLPAARRRALDFGCGVGRVTQALADRFALVVGVDIAPAMIDQARRLNRHGNRCAYLVNARPDLAVLAARSFDLVYSHLVLQHMRPRFALNYVAEFVRLLSPGGVAVFQLPDARLVWGRHPVLSRLAPRWTRRAWSRWKAGRLLERSPPEMSMYWVRRPRVEATVRRAGGGVRLVVEDGGCGREYRSLRYWVVLDPPPSGASTRR
jgi:SAM-dependent methyltransferase